MKNKDKKECKHPMQYRVWTWRGMACDYCGTYQSDFKTIEDDK